MCPIIGYSNGQCPTDNYVPRSDLSVRISCSSSEDQYLAYPVRAGDLGTVSSTTSITPASGVTGMRQDRESLQMQEALRWLCVIIFDKEKRRTLLELKDNNAQSMIDYLNALLSHPDFVAPKLRKHVLIVLRKLCENSMLYPSCYPLDGIENISLIGAGGFCDIYQGRYQGQTLCLKVVRLYQKGDQDKMLKAHAREAILWNQLKHPNVTPFYGIFYLKELQKRISLLSPWMENGNIVGYLKGNPQLPRKQFLYDIASGLEYLHNENIVHGDLKGANVLVDGASTARLSDFGLSKILTDATLGFLDTSDGVTGLTANWASPELLEEHACPTRESDVWAFGCVCYEILTGLSPFHGCTGAQVVRKLIIDRKLPAQPVNDKLDPDRSANKKIWSLLKRCWSFEVARRPHCREILQRMKRDPTMWQLRTEGSNCESQLPLYMAGIANQILDHNQARRFLEITGLSEDEIGMEEPRIVDDKHLNDNQVSFIKQSSLASHQSLRLHCSRRPLPNPPLETPRDATGVPYSPPLCPPAAIHLPPCRPSFRLSPPEVNMDDQEEDGARVGGGESRILDNNHPSGDQMSLINQYFCSMPTWLSSCLQFLCCCRSYSRSLQRSRVGRPFENRISDDRASDEFSPLPVRASQSASQIDAVELNAVQIPNPHDPAAQQPPHPPCPPTPVISTEPPQPPQVQPPLLIDESVKRLKPPSDQPSLQEPHKNPGIFSGAHHFAMNASSFTDRRTEGEYKSITLGNIATSDLDQSMDILQRTIPEAEFARSSPPRCHPGTRVDIIERCLHFITNCSGAKKIRWVFGAAGVGKSAIMQSVAGSPKLPASFHGSVFLSANGRSDGSEVIITLCHQFAAKFERYREFFRTEVKRNPSLLRSSMDTQFGKLIVEPFKPPLSISASRVLIIIDGLDEYENRGLQLKLLELIFAFSATHPSSPLVWLIASRPEHHITSFFSTPMSKLVCENEEIFVDSDDSCKDVRLFLRHELGEIKKGSHLLNRQSEWPKEQEFLALANASDGLFAYAYAAINYIGNPPVGDTASKLRDVLKFIDDHPIPSGPREKHPMALLDALYARILSSVPPEVFGSTRKLLLALALEWDWFLYPGESNFIVMCNWLAMPAHIAYTALSPLFSVLRVPMGSKACGERLKVFHKSFIGYISDFSRSGLFKDIQLEARQLKVLCTQRILKEASAGINFGRMDYNFFFGDLARGLGTGEKISLTWPVYEEVGWNNHDTRLGMYKVAIGWVVDGIRSGEPDFQNAFYIRLLTSRFKSYEYFPYDELSDLVFDESRRDEFMKDGLLEQVPLGAINFSNPDEYVRLWFHCPSSTVASMSDPWNSTCMHKRKGEWEEGRNHHWTANVPRGCLFCRERFNQQLASWKKIRSRMIPVFFLSTEKCCAEFKIAESEVGGSLGPVWTYRLWFRFSSEKRKE